MPPVKDDFGFTTFDQLLVKGVRSGKVPGRDQDSKEWFRDMAKKIKLNRNKLLSDKTSLKNRMALGSMYMFFYDSKMWAEGKQKQLPYYDKFPLIFYLGPSKQHPDLRLGMNLHYLPLKLRARLMDALYEVTNNNRFDDTTKLKITYGILKSAAKFKLFKPTIKSYHKNFFRSRFLKVHSTEWDMALFLPTADWQGARQATVWADSRRKLRK